MLALYLLSNATAGSISRTVAFPVNQTAPTAAIPVNQPVVWEVVYGYDPNLQNMTIASSWAPLTCVVQDGVVKARFSATRGTWPGSWPGSATCSALISGDSTFTTTLTISNCTGADCDRKDFDATAGPPSCPSTWTVTGKGYSVGTCAMSTPPTGKLYASPKWAKVGVNGLDEWSAHAKLGASAAPDTDPQVPGVSCRMGWYTTPNPDVWLTQLVVSEDLKTDLSGIYCPIRLVTTATKAYSWGTEINVVVDRP